MDEKLKVRATQVGLYPEMTVLGEDWKRRRVGDVFTLYPRKRTLVNKVTSKPIGQEDLSIEQQFSPRWMETVDDNTPEHTTSAPKALRKATDAIKASRQTS
jgi:hypothetical protein